ncbi:Pol polyprotein [Elysia marginata]|uniref:Pol polyprotein n=1 Tax=Elysia marginata TaxID=1093978 RepID=A0AAV4GZW3_9GAST|nr:Pol polyprotein [Elysia marginata]
MPFGLKNAAQAFQRHMDGILHDLNCCFVYLDDILIASSSPKEHEADLRSVFHLLATNGLVINTQKCIFGPATMTFLGYKVTPNGITPVPEKVKAITEFPKPSDKKALQRFLGMLNYYHRFLPGIAKCLAPLTEATKSRSKVTTWTDDCQTAFEAAKSSLASATLLNHPDPKSESRLSTDASDSAIGAELSQKHHGMWRPIAFFSRKLTSPQSRYSTFDRELLVIYSAIQHFRFFLEGRPFSVLTDHKPLTYALTSKTARSPQQERQLSYNAEFTTDIRYISGPDNVVPDVLSRSPCTKQPMVASASPIPPIDLAQMAAEQLRDPKEAELRKQPGALKLKEVNLGGYSLLCDVSTSRPRPIVPPLWTKTIFEAIHNLSHPGHKPTTRAISARYVWPGLKREVKNMVRACHSCQASKIGRHTKTAHNSFDPPRSSFWGYSCGSCGTFSPIRRLHIFVHHHRQVHQMARSSANPTTCARALLRNWIARFGVPDSISSDQGPQFTSSLWRELHNVLGCSPKHTTAYHPQSNGMVERFHRSLKAALKARLLGPGWMDELPIVLLGIRSLLKEDLDAAPALLTYGMNLRIPGDFFPVNFGRKNFIRQHFCS